MIINILKCIVLTSIFLVLVLMNVTNAADLGPYDENQYEERYEPRDSNAEVVLRGMEIIAGAIASRRYNRHYYYGYGVPYYYDPYQTYYYDPYGAYAVGPNKYYHRHHRHHRH